ncbi:MAG: hypothetical protein IKC95_04460 [Oscillospiraceae bacterium]|nr:hypothetical protein [Oscillospiraceae bacterium]
MTDTGLQYEKLLKKRLRCTTAVRKRLLEKFRGALLVFLEETPEPNLNQLREAFGPPEEMAQVLMTEVPPEEMAKYRRNRRIRRIAAGAIAVVFVLFTMYVYFEKQKPLVMIDEANDLGIVSTENTP